MTGGPRPSASAGGALRLWLLGRAGLLSARLGCGLGQKRPARKRFAFSFFSDFYFQTYLNSKQILNSNQDLNPNTQKQCTSMYATVNSYISLIN